MAKITRVLQKVFGLTGDQSHFAAFGSRIEAPPGVFTKDPATIQSEDAFTNNGLKQAVNPVNSATFLEDLNGIFLLAFRQLASIFQDGIPEYEAGTSYYIGSIVRKAGTFEQYGSIVDDNVGNALPSQASNAYWQYLNPPSVAPGVMSDFGGDTAPFGYLLCDGTSYPTASYPALFTAIGYKWGGVGANFNVPNMQGRTSIGPNGDIGLAVGQLTGEKTHVLVKAEIPTALDVNDPGHGHSVTNSKDGNAAQVGATQATIAGASPGNFLPVAGATNVVALVGNHTTGISVGGGGGAHNNVQPSAVVNKIIKF